MTIQNIIDNVNAIIQPSEGMVTQCQIVSWLNIVEGKIQQTVMLTEPEKLVQYRYPDDLGAELLVGGGFEDLYMDFILYKLDYYNGEFSSCQNRLDAFNAAFSEFECWYVMKYHPADQDTSGEVDENE